uniref:Retrotransposon gag domain-containing protein n=1 Tax=Acanthochromis polyacanthus TaxID=80966 RepID=A0A3Q1EX16_9TELE
RLTIHSIEEYTPIMLLRLCSFVLFACDVSDARLKAMLIHSLGSEGQRILLTLGPAEKYTDCITFLSRHFAAPQSIIVRRIVFCQRRQRPSESVHQYVVDLQGLASLCKFGTLENEMIRDQLAEHATDLKLCEKLFMAPDDTTLSKAVEIAFQLESAALLASQLAASDLAPSHPASLAAQTVAVATEPPTSKLT